jgi:4-diphosphocytidyl-2-C-methyl-D-erythritol kinase
VKSEFLTFFSPAKVNLFFKVLFKRKDGYHEIASLYQAISLGDILHFRLSDKDELKCSESSIACDQTNLVARAIDLFRKKTNLFFRVEVLLEKFIPIQAGLGGGSSNAATTLYAINELLKKPCSEGDLISIAKEIGSDVAFFFSRGTAFCKGRGEIFEEILPQPFKAVIAKPAWGLSTAEVYKNVKISELEQVDLFETMKSYYEKKNNFFNDLEKAAFFINPEQKKVKENLRECFERVHMTGSGSAFYCLGEQKNELPDNVDTWNVEGVWRNSSMWYSLENKG